MDHLRATHGSRYRPASRRLRGSRARFGRRSAGARRRFRRSRRPLARMASCRGPGRWRDCRYSGDGLQPLPLCGHRSFHGSTIAQRSRHTARRTASGSSSPSPRPRPWRPDSPFRRRRFNLNVVPSIAANGGVTVWLWLISLLLFFWPQGIAVIELAHRYPGEGGVYLWAKEVFGDFHGFLSGWCYWTNNMMYVPTVMLYFVGVSVYVLGPGHAALADSKAFALSASVLLLLFLVVLNIVGLGVGKWINNLGGIGTFVAAALLIGLGVIVWVRFGASITSAGFQFPANPRFVLNSFGVICFGLVGLELASVMGDEIAHPERTLPGAVAWGGLLSGLLYVGATLTLLVAVNKSQISVLQGIVQAVGHMAARVGAAWIIAPFAFLLSISIAGIGSAWLGGSARIPFVAGLDSYMPPWLGKIHPRYGTPYAALIVHAAISMILVIINFSAAGVQ